MKHTPILFSTPMVQAILNGTKTQTRRIVKSIEKITEFISVLSEENYWKPEIIGTYLFLTEDGELMTKPKAEIGDILWVRETWAEVGNFAGGFDNSEVIAYRTEHAFFYENQRPLDTYAWNWDKIKWKPSIFMPKEACRLFLEVTNVRVERLHDISEDDAMAEGIGIYTKDNTVFNHGLEKWEWQSMTKYAKEAFFKLWESINGKESLDANPWVWVYDFKVVEKPTNF